MQAHICTMLALACLDQLIRAWQLTNRDFLMELCFDAAHFVYTVLCSLKKKKVSQIAAPPPTHPKVFPPINRSLNLNIWTKHGCMVHSSHHHCRVSSGCRMYWVWWHYRILCSPKVVLCLKVCRSCREPGLVAASAMPWRKLHRTLL